MYLQKNVIYCKLDLNNSQDLNHFIKQKQIDVIIHFAFDHTYNNNIKMIKSISNAAIKNNIKNLISSISVLKINNNKIDFDTIKK